MTIEITQVQVVAGLVGVVVGYKGRNIISGWLEKVKAAVAKVTTIKK